MISRILPWVRMVPLNGIGNDLAQRHHRNSLNNSITGGGGADTLSGGPAAAVDVDTFVYTNLADSLLANFDRITRFNVAVDQIDVSARFWVWVLLPSLLLIITLHLLMRVLSVRC